MKWNSKLFTIAFSILALSFLGGQFNKKVILFLGDSLTDGDGVAEEKTFAHLVGKGLDGYKSINQGRSGWSTEAYLRRWEEVEKDFPPKADIVFIQLCANDYRIFGHHDSTLTICIANMKLILQKLRDQFPNAEIVLMSSTMIDVTHMDETIKGAGFGDLTNEYLCKTGDAYSSIATDQQINFVDLYRMVPLGNTLDGAHLNEVGHKITANVILRFLGTLFQSKMSDGQE